MKLLIVSGMSGAGKSLAVDCLEDMGYYCIDNIPPIIIPKIAQVCMQSKIDNLALVTDLRGKDMFYQIYESLNELKKNKMEYDILFLEASNEVLVKRFSETRRKHPLVSEDSTVLSAIIRERFLLKDLRELSKYVIDTSNMSSHNLGDQLKRTFNEGKESDGIVTHVVSFGFKYGMPLDADLVFDVRFLPNPFYIDELKNHTGLDKDVRDYVFSFDQANDFFDKLYDMVDFLLPRYIDEGKSQLVIAIGCTGGMHRSVAVANKLYEKLTENGYKNVYSVHREITAE